MRQIGLEDAFCLLQEHTGFHEVPVHTMRMIMTDKTSHQWVPGNMEWEG